jgi:hypothetical protein
MTTTIEPMTFVALRSGASDRSNMATPSSALAGYLLQPTAQPPYAVPIASCLLPEAIASRSPKAFTPGEGTGRASREAGEISKRQQVEGMGRERDALGICDETRHWTAGSDTAR